MKQSIIDPQTYNALSDIWKDSPKIRYKTTPQALATMRLVTESPFAVLGEHLPYLTQLQINLADWIFPIARFPHTHDIDMRKHAEALALLNSELIVAVSGNKLTNGEVGGIYNLGILHQIYTQQYLFATYRQPIKLSKIRYSVTHLSFGEYLKCNHPSMDNSERIIRAFFRQYKLKNAVED